MEGGSSTEKCLESPGILKFSMENHRDDMKYWLVTGTMEFYDFPY